MRQEPGYDDLWPPSRRHVHIKLLRYWLPLALYMGLIYVQSSYVPPVALTDFEQLDKLAHLGMYAVLGALFLRAYLSLTNGRYGLWCALISIVSTFIYGLTDEWHQSLVPGRVPEIFDLLADGIGAIVGVCFYRVLYRHRTLRTTVTPD